MYSAEEHIIRFEKVFGPYLATSRQTEAYKYLSENIIGNSPIIEEIKFLIERFAQSNDNLLLLGETGTGKELIARNIHDLSMKVYNKTGRFIIVNSPAIPFEMMESELFGHVKGAFTNAYFDKAGLLELANNGTIFFDELDRMSLAAQAKLLRVIDTKEFSRLGSNKIIKLENTRIIASTKPNLQELIDMKVFLQDHRSRLNSCFPTLPALREIKSDIPVFVNHFIQQKSSKLKIHQPAMEIIKQQPWLDNIRELKNFISCLIILYPEKLHSIGKDEVMYALDLHHKSNTQTHQMNNCEYSNVQSAFSVLCEPDAKQWFLKFVDIIHKLSYKNDIIYSKDVANELKIDPAIISKTYQKYKTHFKTYLQSSEYSTILLILLKYQPFKRLLKN